MKPRKIVQEMQPYAAPSSYRKGFLRLDFNENSLGVSDSIRKELCNITAEELATYPECIGLERAIAQYACVSQEQVLSCNGSDAAIKIAFDCFLERGKKAVIPWPSFSMFEQCALASEARIKRVLYEKNLSFPTEKVLSAIDSDTGVVVLCNPNNPTGTIIPQSSIRKIVEKANQDCALVLIDEAYFEFSKETSVQLLNEFGNVVITRTFSKAFGLAGLRLGYLLSTSENIAEMRKVALPFDVNCIATKIAIRALKQKDLMEKYVQEILEAKKFSEKEFSRLGIEFFPSRANFLLVRFGKNCSKIVKGLQEKGILLRDRSNYDLLEGCARVTIGPSSQMEEFFAQLEKIFCKRLLAFDMDGVLVDVSQSYRKAIQGTVEFFTEKRLSMERIQEYKNKLRINNDWKLSQKIIESLGKNVPLKAVVQKFQELYLGKSFDGLILNESWLFEKKLLKKLAEKNEICILTGRPKEEALFALRRFGVKGFFKTVISMDDLPKEKQKPDPFGLLQLRKKFGTTENYYFGDTLSDIACAKAAGFFGVGVLPPQDKSNGLSKKMLWEGAIAVLKDINEIEEAIK